MARKRLKPIEINNKILYHCLDCNSFRPEEEFSIRTDTGKLRSQCNTCRSKESALYHRRIRKNLSINARKESLEEWKKRQNDPYYALKQFLINRSRKSAHNRKLEFTITTDDINIPDKCPILDIPFDPNDKKYTYSLDRIDNSKGYIPGNVAVISNYANTLKRDASYDELMAFAKNIVTYIKR